MNFIWTWELFLNQPFWWATEQSFSFWAHCSRGLFEMQKNDFGIFQLNPFHHFIRVQCNDTELLITRAVNSTYGKSLRWSIAMFCQEDFRIARCRHTTSNKGSFRVILVITYLLLGYSCVKPEETEMVFLSGWLMIHFPIVSIYIIVLIHLQECKDRLESFIQLGKLQWLQQWRRSWLYDQILCHGTGRCWVIFKKIRRNFWTWCHGASRRNPRLWLELETVLGRRAGTIQCQLNFRYPALLFLRFTDFF